MYLVLYLDVHPLFLDDLYQPRNHMFILYINPIDHCAIWTTLA
jgi:hypothetical protein